MIYQLSGTLLGKRETFAILDVGGIGYQIFLSAATIGLLPEVGSDLTLFTFHHVKEDEESLYGFLEENELRFFELLITVSGVGPKSALSVLASDTVEHLMAAILEGRAELLSRASGVGKKTAERIVLELKTKIRLPESHSIAERMDTDAEVEELLVGLGYLRGQVKKAVAEVGKNATTLEDKIRKSLQILGKKHPSS